MAAFLSSEEYSHEYLKNCKRLYYFKSKNGNPALSIATTGRLKFPTPIAHCVCGLMGQIWPAANVA